MTHVDQAPPDVSKPRSTRGLLEFVLLVVGAEVCRHLDFPFRTAGVLFALAAVVLGVVLVTRRGSAGRSPRSTVLLWIGVAAAGGLLLWHIGLLVVSPLFGDYERCLDEALTREATQSCQEDLTRRVDSLRGGGR